MQVLATVAQTIFLSTPSARRATYHQSSEHQSLGDFYPRPPRGGRRAGYVVIGNTITISIHALREEGDFFTHKYDLPNSYFYPRPPRGGRPARIPLMSTAMHFYPRPPRGGRPPLAPRMAAFPYFYPRPPRGGRPRLHRRSCRLSLFLSTPSARRATPTHPNSRNCIPDFYPRPPRGGRHQARWL